MRQHQCANLKEALKWNLSYIKDSTFLNILHNRVSQKNETLFLLKISATKYQIFKLFFFFPEKWDPYANLEYTTISVQYLGTEIFAKKNGILDEMILIKTQII